MKKLFSFFLLALFCSIGNVWGALNNSTVTKTGSSQKFLDVASVVASSGDEVTKANQYAAYKISELVTNAIKGVWYTQVSSSSGSNESATVSAAGFRSQNSKYISVTSTNTQTFYIHGAVGIAVLYDPRANNRFYTITATNVDDDTDVATITDNQKMSSGNQYVLNLTDLDATKYYKVVVKSSDSNGTRMFQLRVEGATSTNPAINASDVTINADATSGEIAYTISNPVNDVNPTIKSTTGDWISNVAINTSTKKITFDATENTGDVNRTATITISYTGAEDKVVTITQKKHVVYTVYDKVSSTTMVVGGTYVWYAERSNGTDKSVATAMGEQTYFAAQALDAESQLTATQLKLTTEVPQQFVFNQLSETDWTIADAGTPTNYLYLKGDKQLAWSATANVWVMSGTMQPAFTCSSYNSTAYTMFANLGSTRFCAYTGSSSSTQNAILYHLASEAAHTLSCVIDGETTETYNIKDGFTWTLLSPEKDGYVFEGWYENSDFSGEAITNVTLSAAKTIYAKMRAQTTAPVITTNLNATYSCNKGGAALVLTIEATDADNYQWYKNASATTEGATAISGATTASYSYTGTTIGVEYIYCVATNAVGSTTSTIAAVTTKGSNLCALSHLEYSNSFDAFIKNNTVTAYYMAGETAPSVVEESIAISAGATYEINGTTLTVTAEDGETTKEYSLVLTVVSPTTAAATAATFDGTETWIKTGNVWETAKGWKFSRNMDGSDDSRIVDGRNRQYWFVGPAAEFTLINTGVTSDRNIKVYVNGVEQTGITKIAKKTDSAPGSISITGLSTTGNNMVAIVSDQNGGDGGFTKYTFTPAPNTITVNYGWATYYNSTMAYTMPDGMTGYIFNESTMVEAYQAGEVVPAGEALLLKAANGTYTLTATTTEDTPMEGNALYGSDNVADAATASETTANDNYYYGLALNASSDPNSIGFYWMKADGSTFNNAAHRAFLVLPKSAFEGSKAPARIVFGGQVATDIESVNAETVAQKVMINGQVFILRGEKIYTAQGQLVK